MLQYPRWLQTSTPDPCKELSIPSDTRKELVYCIYVTINGGVRYFQFFNSGDPVVTYAPSAAMIYHDYNMARDAIDKLNEIWHLDISFPAHRYI